ncbi:Cell wall-associated hydrolase, NlpC family [Clostridium cavendishii DSM 21758]|uniref:Cell wall-associated hydrolase, NlpC family n=1 Tax=Clostridium cavendishii DSM 21758 TaxID=1121302 RepID=A0A1M6BLE9_9CLOT|nr:C40 family peptidase [Clostridium cavendishii]SHI49545.1 Cell wall-associated hydrolase, NlpC family [Clostridium cavendishii DSM 21758]
MKLKKCLIIASVFSIALISNMVSENKVVKADTTVKTQQGVVLKSTQLKGEKTIIAPKKEEAVSDSGSNSSSEKKSSGSKSSGGNGPSSRGGSSSGSAVVQYAYNFIGRPYVFGAAGPKVFDCSGLTQYVYARFGVSLGHYTGSQWGAGSSVSRGNLQPGDLVFFNTYGPISHVGIYVGGGDFIHAPSSGKTVTVSSLGESYYASRYAGARRVK